MTLVEFLTARIGEDEAVARAALVDHWGYEVGTPEGFIWTSLVLSSERDTTPAQDDFIERHAPARALAECEAKRRIVEWCTAEEANKWEIGPILALLALPYADHPDYRAEWRP